MNERFHRKEVTILREIFFYEEGMGWDLFN